MSSTFVETAINIGYSCKLLREDMQVHCIDGDNSDDIVRDLQAIVIAHREVNNNFKSSTESNVSQVCNIYYRNLGNFCVINFHGLNQPHF